MLKMLDTGKEERKQLLTSRSSEPRVNKACSADRKGLILAAEQDESSSNNYFNLISAIFEKLINFSTFLLLTIPSFLLPKLGLKQLLCIEKPLPPTLITFISLFLFFPHFPISKMYATHAYILHSQWDMFSMTDGFLICFHLKCSVSHEATFLLQSSVINPHFHFDLVIKKLK